MRKKKLTMASQSTFPDHTQADSGCSHHNLNKYLTVPKFQPGNGKKGDQRIYREKDV
jgi:hypothetical protein